MEDWMQTLVMIGTTFAVFGAVGFSIKRQVDRIVDKQDCTVLDMRTDSKRKRRFDDRDHRSYQLEQEVQDLRVEVRKMEIKQVRMLGFLEGRGVIGKAPAGVE
jgi:hypothetical protein